MPNQALLDYIKEKADEFTREFTTSRIQYLAARKISVTNELVRSIQAESKILLSDAIVETSIAFEDYGRYIEMKKLQPAAGGSDLIGKIEEWISKRGFARFKNKFEKAYGRVINEQKAINRLAWAIIRTRSEGKFKAKRWHTKARNAKMYELYNEILAGLPEVVSEEVRKALGQ